MAGPPGDWSEKVRQLRPPTLGRAFSGNPGKRPFHTRRHRAAGGAAPVPPRGQARSRRFALATFASWPRAFAAVATRLRISGTRLHGPGSGRPVLVTAPTKSER